MLWSCGRFHSLRAMHVPGSLNAEVEARSVWRVDSATGAVVVEQVWAHYGQAFVYPSGSRENTSAHLAMQASLPVLSLSPKTSYSVQSEGTWPCIDINSPHWHVMH